MALLLSLVLCVTLYAFERLDGRTSFNILRSLFQIGDEILKVNGFVLHESIHDEVVNVLKSKKSLTFVTKSE